MGAAPDAASAPSPASPAKADAPGAARAARLLARADNLFTRTDTLLERALPRPLNPLAHLGAAANAMLLLATLSGVLLLLWYSPSVHQAWGSLDGLGPRSPGGLVRSVHRHSSDLAMLLILLHAARAFCGRMFSGPRWLAWVSGLGLLALVWFVGWTGYWLVWDERAQLVAVDTMKTVDALPVFGEPMLRLFSTDATVPSLLFFVIFFLHMLLPLGLAAGLALHLARLSRVKLLPDWRLTAWLTGAVVLAAFLVPAASAPPARMAVQPEAFTMDWWYLWPLALTGRLTSGGVWLAALLGAAGLVTVPWWLGRRRPRASFQATVNLSRCFACTQCSQDCPFGAITMVPRTDGKPFPAQAQVDPDRCTGCGVCTGACDTQGIGLAWLDAQQVTRELEQLVADGVANGRAPALALVCAQTAGGWDLFDESAWRRRLPGYTVRPVPCAGWLEPKAIERLLAQGVRAVLVVSCGSAMPFAREGALWLDARLAGARKPVFRPQRADPRKVAHVAFDPLRPQHLTAAASLLLDGNRPMLRARCHPAVAWLVGAALTVLAGAAVLGIGDAPFRNPASPEPEFVFSFRAFGDWLETGATAGSATRDDRPVHMRGTLPATRTRAPVTVVVEVDGRRVDRLFRPKGLQADGASVGEVRLRVPAGPQRVAVTLLTSPQPNAAPLRWTGEINARPRHRHVLAFEPGAGFMLAPEPARP